MGPQFGLDPLEIVVGGFTSDQCWSLVGEVGKDAVMSYKYNRTNIYMYKHGRNNICAQLYKIYIQYLL